MVLRMVLIQMTKSFYLAVPKLEIGNLMVSRFQMDINIHILQPNQIGLEDMVGGFARDIEIKVYLKDFMYHQLETLAIILITLLTLVLIITNTYSVSVLVNWQHNYLGTIMVPSLFFLLVQR